MKIKFISQLVLSFFILIFINHAIAKSLSDDWVLLKSENDVSIYYKPTICNEVNSVALRVDNSNLKQVQLVFSLWEDVPEKKVTIPGNSFLEGSCNITPHQLLIDPIPEGLSITDLQVKINIGIL